MLEIGNHPHPKPHPNALFLLMYKGGVLISEYSTDHFQHSIHDFQPTPSTTAIFCGQWKKQDVFVCILKTIPKGFQERPLRELLLTLDPASFSLLSRARQLATWEIDHKFCARCGTRLDSRHEIEHTKICPSCNNRSYPRVSPCVIVSIRKNKQILLARGVGAASSRFANIAGFVEAGETLEEAVIREVKEEVGLTVKNLRYYSSQAWSFPHQLMMGFLAEYEAGEITPAEGEIEEAHWFDADKLPDISPPTTISGQIIRENVRQILNEG